MTRKKTGPGKKTLSYPMGALTEAEEKLWKKVTLGITKLDCNRAAAPLIRRSAYRISASNIHWENDVSWEKMALGQKSLQAPSQSLTEQSFTLRDADHNWQQKMRRGKVKPEGRIDLHGMTQDKAFGALSRYIEQAQHRGKRFILVITGKGGAKSDPQGQSYGDLSYGDHERSRGVLKTNVPRWLSQGDLGSRIVSYTSANVEHGGEGALYVVLKRIK